MKKILYLISLTLLSINNISAQNKFKSREFGISMNVPEGWVVIDDQEAKDVIESIKLKPESRDHILENRKQSIPLFSYLKYPAEANVKVNPKISMQVRTFNPTTFDSFMAIIKLDASLLDSIFEEYKFIVEPRKVNLGGVDAVFLSVQYRLNSITGSSANIKSDIYAIPMNGYFLQLNLSEELGNSECSKLFDQILKSVEITDNYFVEGDKLNNSKKILISELVGFWKSTEEYEEGSFEFDENGFVEMINAGDTIGGESYFINGIEVEMRYEVDENLKNEHNSLDLIIYHKKRHIELLRYFGIYLFTEYGNLKLCLSFEGSKRPTLFDPEDSIILERTQK